MTGVLLAVSLGLSLRLPDLRLGENLIHLSYDIPFLHRPSGKPPRELVVVYLDDDSFHNLNQPYVGPWDRGLYAQFLGRLTAEKARAVTFDIIFSDPNTQYPQGDARFARAIKAEGHVILGRDFGPGAQGG